MTKKEVAFILNGDRIAHEVEPVLIPQIGEWVQLYTEQTYKNFIVRHVLHKFVRGFGNTVDAIHRVIIILEEIEEEV